MIASLYSQSARPIMGVAENMPQYKGSEVGDALRPDAVTVKDQSLSPNESRDNQTDKKPQPEPQKTGKDGVDLNSPEVQKMLSELKSRDMEVKAHEMAHLAAAGQYATSGANYSYQTGPDGKQYAIGGDVGIDTSAVDGDPQATLAKAQQVFSAAMAPAQPSSQDFKVAQSAQNMMSQALSDIQAEQQQKTSGKDEAGNASETADNTQKEDTAQEVSSNQNSLKRQQQGSDSQAIKTYQGIDIATNASAGLVGGWQNSANRLGLSFQA